VDIDKVDLHRIVPLMANLAALDAQIRMIQEALAKKVCEVGIISNQWLSVSYIYHLQGLTFFNKGQTCQSTCIIYSFTG
jgi:hypothetical protein